MPSTEVPDMQPSTRARRGDSGCEYATTLELVTENSNMDPSLVERNEEGGGCPLNHSQTM